ncbi:MAG: hypothetical protein KDJ52_21150 [Anaerolineae bacterium]|nr:hypothetical protein [Anaerolineae bacterium]
MSDLQDKPKTLLNCPTTGRVVEPIRRVNVRVGSEMVMWWRCPACQGWHLQKRKGKDTKLED